MSLPQDPITSYKNQLNTRFYSNSMSVQVLVCLVLIFIFVIEIVKFFKKTYEWQSEYEIKIELKFTEESRNILREKSQLDGINVQPLRPQAKKQEEGPKSRGERIKKQPFVPTLIRIEEIIKNKIPQIAIIAVNVAMIASYEYCAIVTYISIVIIVISELINSEHVKLKLGLEAISKILLITLYINIFTVAKPSSP